MKIPCHIAIIMDGNGRWAKKRGLPRSEGHRRGINNVRSVIKGCKERGVKILTLFCFSTENWKRPKREVHFLMKQLENFLDREVPKLDKEGIRVKIIGELQMLPKNLQEKMDRAQNKTRDNNKLVLNLAISYGSRQELLHAVKEIARDYRRGTISLDDVDERLFNKHLYTSDIPEPDLLIRTSGEKRISNFLLWQLSYAEIYFTSTCWPDFDRESLDRAIQDYSKRERKFGEVTDQ